MEKIAAWLLISLCFPFASFGDNQPIMQNTAQTAADITNLDALYSFVVNNELYDIDSRKDFDSSVSVTFLDVTADGRNDAILYNDANWSEEISVITADNGFFQAMKTDIKPAKYSNTFAMEDGFLVFRQETGGTGIHIETLSLARYHNSAVVTVLRDLETSLLLSQSDMSCEEISEIQGNFNDFEYLLKRIKDDTVTQLEHARYIYNHETFTFNVTKITQTTEETGSK